ncbi:hypothetical protein LIER_39199 [Lithospermum erythrorhizon]|uniref:Reverse transcriptase Ty1/copia-type domain-containing protein n=1 Tax=Lithospermum erythrorhizon TaxID=34254 RepID=A0AAV3QFF9_LITER
MLIVGADLHKINMLKNELSVEFAMKDLGDAKKILGMRIIRDRDSLRLTQEEYLKKVIKRFNMLDAKPVSTPIPSHFQLSVEQSPETEDELVHMDKVPYASAVGSLMYAMVCTRPDIAHAVGVVSRYMSNPGREHWEAVKWILRYLNGSAEKALCFQKYDKGLMGYVDADNSGYVFTFGGTAISWRSKLQSIVALSSCEADDSQSAIYLAKNPVFHARTKHIGLRYHFIWSVLENGVLKLEKIPDERNPADMFTKVVNKEKLKLCSTSVNLQNE